ncbi:hypothetical protein [Roseisalinus antarcticus]|uniref:Tetratricopeptide repeat-like domain-containing protein n=1 Tax=Roseisalinus antarcticus TaxID=254357 RepID=A0A1Y5T6R8_9RHOB|nr:hypothetical protein [Roseisalinus antarcticus]SLN55213.1 hypothetical protein ROA7023_02505 [Roseisalinus antarcticus]
MSNNESFIDEVSEEVRRDRLYGAFRRYGWIGVLVVLLVVGGTAWTQYSAARDRAVAEARGDALLDALDRPEPEGRAEALAQIEEAGASRAVVGFLTADAQVEAGDAAAGVATLRTVADDGEVGQLYRELALLKALMLDEEMPPAERAQALGGLGQPGAPFRLVALEQQAFALVEAGDTEGALAVLQGLLEDAEVTRGLRDRASALIVSLGGEIGGQGNDLPPSLE